MNKHRRKIGSGDAERFDQRKTMFSRPRDTEQSSAEILAMGKKHYGVRRFKDDEGYTLLDWAFAMGNWYLERCWGFGNISGNDTALSIPLAIDAGLGEIGRNGLLIAPGFGPRVRISKVFTNLPLVPDKPIDIGVRRMCEVCGKCAKACPGNAISLEEPTDKGPTLSNNHGIHKWYINPEKCFGFWVRNKGDCANCIRVCVFNKPNSLLHSFVRWHVKNLSQFDNVYLKMDDVFGYGRRLKMSEIWK